MHALMNLINQILKNKVKINIVDPIVKDINERYYYQFLMLTSLLIAIVILLLMILSKLHKNN
jgi:hypothetical protein